MNKLKNCIVSYFILLYRSVLYISINFALLLAKMNIFKRLSPVINLEWHVDSRILFDIFKGFAREKAIGPSNDICVPFFLACIYPW